MPAGFVPACHAAIAARREPESGDPWHSPLPTMAMSTEDQINTMMIFNIVQDVRGMSQQYRTALFRTRRDTSKVRTMKGRIIDTDNH